MADWYVYMLRCANGALYTGISTDVERRLREHRAGRGRAARYTRSAAAMALVYQVRLADRALAARVEYRIKQLTKAQKERLVRENYNRSELLVFLKM